MIQYAIAFLAALAIPVGMVILYRLARSISPDRRLVLLFAFTGIGALLAVALTPRAFFEFGRVFPEAEALSNQADSFLATRILNVVVLGGCAVEVVRGMISSRASVVPDPARHILLALVIFYAGTTIVEACLSEHPNFSYKGLYIPVLVIAVYYQRVEDIQKVTAAAKLAIFALMVFSLLGIPIAPDFVMLRPYQGIPGLDFRLFGLATHANTLGPIALIGLILELQFPTPSRLLRAAQLISTTAVLILAQSKTAWIAGSVLVLLVVLPLQFVTPARTRAEAEARRVRTISAVVIGIVGLVIVAIGSAMIDISALLDQSSVDAKTLTGRTIIWQITLDAWRENVFFGYGPDIWAPDRMAKFNMFYVGQAHNQFIQTLGESGLSGALFLAILLMIFLHESLRRFVVSRGLTASFLIIIFVRCMTEAPLKRDEPLSWPTMTIVLMVIYACYYARLAPSSRPVRSGAPASYEGSADPYLLR